MKINYFDNVYQVVSFFIISNFKEPIDDCYHSKFDVVVVVAVLQIQNTVLAVAADFVVVEGQVRNQNRFHQSEKNEAAEPVSTEPAAEDRFQQPV